jgi:hypothetical protein
MEEIFCKKCAKQLSSLDEIAHGICNECQAMIIENMKSSSFFCEICGTQLTTMNDVARGICSSCKASILIKIQ